jgi:hypothetical protein
MKRTVGRGKKDKQESNFSTDGATGMCTKILTCGMPYTTEHTICTCKQHEFTEYQLFPTQNIFFGTGARSCTIVL